MAADVTGAGRADGAAAGAGPRCGVSAPAAFPLRAQAALGDARGSDRRRRHLRRPVDHARRRRGRRWHPSGGGLGAAKQIAERGREDGTGCRTATSSSMCLRRSHRLTATGSARSR